MHLENFQLNIPDRVEMKERPRVVERPVVFVLSSFPAKKWRRPSWNFLNFSLKNVENCNFVFEVSQHFLYFIVYIHSSFPEFGSAPQRAEAHLEIMCSCANHRLCLLCSLEAHSWGHLLLCALHTHTARKPLAAVHNMFHNTVYKCIDVVW